MQSLIDAAGNNKVGRDKGGSNETNLSNLSAFKKYTKADYLIFKGAKKDGGNSNSGGNNTQNGVIAVKNSNYKTLGTKKVFSLLQHVIT